MSGKAGRYLLDTNAVIALLQGHPLVMRSLRDAEWIGISVISQLEFLAFPALPEADQAYFRLFLQRVAVIGLSPQDGDYLDTIIRLRQQYRLKLPDAIIAATALLHDATLITADKQFQVVTELLQLDFTA